MQIEEEKARLSQGSVEIPDEHSELESGLFQPERYAEEYKEAPRMARWH